MSIDLERAYEMIRELFAKYETDHEESIAAVVGSLPALVQAHVDKHIEQKERRRTTEDRIRKIGRLFTETLTPRYYYIPITSTFVMCDGDGYQLAKEDEILAAILPVLQNDDDLCRTKHKSKHAVMRLIKANSLLECIPDSGVIQRVLGVCHTVFTPTKCDAKHLLTRIGDILLRKHPTLLTVMSQEALEHMIVLSELIIPLIGQRHPLRGSCTSSYSEEDAPNCRIVRTHGGIADSYAVLKPCVLEIIAVSCHYSTRFASGDGYVKNIATDTAVRDACFSADTTSTTDSVERFAQERMSPAEDWTTPQEHVSLSWSAWAHTTNVFLKVPIDRVLNQQPYSVKDGKVNCTLAMGEYMQAAASFCRTTLTIDTRETLLEFSELYEFFVETKSECSHACESLFHSVARLTVTAMGASCDGSFVHGAAFTLWDKRKEVEDFLATVDTSRGLNVFAAYRVYAMTVPGRKTSRAYFIQRAEELGR